MHRILTTTLAMLGLAVANVNAETLTKPIPGASMIDIDLAAQIEFKQGDDEKIVIEAEPKVLEAMVVKHSGNKLSVSAKSYRTKLNVKVTVTVKKLAKYTHAGSGQAVVRARKEDSFTFDGKGGGNATVENLQASSLTIDLNGGMDISASGKSEKASYVLSGSGKIAAGKLLAETVNAELSGAGEIEVHANKTLNAKHAGSGDIRYRGKPKVTKSLNGSGSIEPI